MLTSLDPNDLGTAVMAETDSVDPRTVFIKGISFDWDNSDFEKAVSDIGPVRKCFLLKGAGKHHKVNFNQRSGLAAAKKLLVCCVEHISEEG